MSWARTTRYTPTTCFETFPFPAGLTPADTAHQKTEEVANGALIPADLPDEQSEAGAGRMLGATLKSPKDAEHPASALPRPGRHQQSGSQLASISVKSKAIEIAKAAKHLNQLRENWLNPPEWTHRVPKVIPLGMDKSPYPERIEPKPGIDETDLKALQQWTLTKLYNQRPAWLTIAHQQLDQAVAAAYG